jgi:hypothetical protein
MHAVDGAVWIVDYAGIHARLPSTLLDRLRGDDTGPFRYDLLKGALESPEEFDGLASASNKYVLFFENPGTDLRISVQAGLFSAISDPALSLNDLFPDIADCFVKVIVRSSLKRELRERLDVEGRTEARLFPDGHDGLCRTIARQVEMGNDPEIN